MNDISRKQLSLMIFFIPLAFKMAMLPSLLYKECGADFYVGIGVVTAIEFLFLALILKIVSLGGFSAIEEKYGLTAKRLLAAPFLLSLSIKTVLLSAELYRYVTQFLFYNVSTLPIIAVLCIAVFYIALKGAKNIGRILELAVWLVPLIVIFGLFFGKSSMCGDYLAPLFTDGISGMLRGIDKYFVYAFDFSPFLFFNVKKGKKSSVVVASVLSVVSVVGCYMVFLLSYGRASSLIADGFAHLASFNTVISEIGSLDWPSALLWLTVTVCNMSLKLCAVAEILSYFKINRHISIGIFAVALGVVLAFATNTFRKAADFVTGPIRYAVLATETLIPAAILVMCLIKRQKEEKLVKKN